MNKISEFSHRNDDSKGKKRGKFSIVCNICGRSFCARSRFARFCASCKADSDVFGYAEWLPQANLSGFRGDRNFREAA